MEAELLRGMIADREKRMEKIQRKTEEQRLQAVELSQQLEVVAAKVAEQNAVSASERTSLLRNRTLVMNRLEQMQRDFRQQGASMQTYSRDPVPAKQGDASYVMRMQAQLCKAMHSLGITDHQMDLARKHADSILKYQKEKLAVCTEERTSTELGLMNQLIAKDNERREVEAVFLAKLDAIAKEREALERQLEENGDDSDDEQGQAEQDEDEEDAAEKEVKEELLKLLAERRAEIERLEQLQEEQEELIVELEEQMAEIGGEGAIYRQSLSALPPETSGREHANGDGDEAGIEELQEAGGGYLDERVNIGGDEHHNDSMDDELEEVDTSNGPADGDGVVNDSARITEDEAEVVPTEEERTDDNLMPENNDASVDIKVDSPDMVSTTQEDGTLK